MKQQRQKSFEDYSDDGREAQVWAIKGRIDNEPQVTPIKEETQEVKLAFKTKQEIGNTTTV